MSERDIAIQINQLSKVYKLYEKPVDRLKETMHPFRKKYHSDFYALKDVSFEVKKGDTVGILGKNGSGKSTLLKIITGVLHPTFGTVQVNGKVAALLELGAGFNPEFTGLENIYLNGTIMGYAEAEIDAMINDILAFADIGEFVHQPVKMYSSGMFARLAFAVNVSVRPDILIVDEALSVGDMFFQAKCIDRMKRMMDEGTTILFVSHDTAAIKSLCNKGILLDSGTVISDSDADEAVEKYFSIKVQGEQQTLQDEAKSEFEGANAETAVKFAMFSNNTEFQKRAQYQRIQNGKAEFCNIQLIDMSGNEVKNVDYGQKIKLRMAIAIHEDISELEYGYHIRSATGVDVIYSDSNLEKSTLYRLKKGDCYMIDWEFVVNLMEGNYNMVCVMSVPVDLSLGKVEFCDLVPCAVQFSIRTNDDEKLYGFVHWENKVSVIKALANENES